MPCLLGQPPAFAAILTRERAKINQDVPSMKNIFCDRNLQDITLSCGLGWTVPASAWIPVNQRLQGGEVGLGEQQHKPSADVPVKGRQRGLQMNWCVKGWKRFSRSALSFVMFL